MPNYRFSLNIDSLERAPPPPRRFEDKYVYILATSVRHVASSSSPPFEAVMDVPLVISRSHLFTDTWRSELRSILYALSGWTEPPRQLVDRLADESASVGRAIAADPVFNAAPVVPLRLDLEIDGVGPTGGSGNENEQLRDIRHRLLCGHSLSA